jgi:hypothetical protein
MNRFRRGNRVAAVCAAIALGAPAAGAAVELPVTELRECPLADGATQLSLADLPFKTAAHGRVVVPTKGSPRQKTQRTETGTAAVYESLPAVSRPLLPPFPSGDDVFDFKETSDAAQAWATMTDAGIPYLFVQGFGRFEATGTAAWTATLTTPNQPAEVIVRFTIPSAGVTGNTEQDGPALWQSRIRAELLVNGYPAWSTEALRFNEKDGAIEKNRYLESFGQTLSFPPGANTASTPRTVCLTLGTLPGNLTLELGMVLRASSRTLDDPDVLAADDNECVEKNDEFFCSRGTATVQGDPDGVPAFLLRTAP